MECRVLKSELVADVRAEVIVGELRLVDRVAPRERNAEAVVSGRDVEFFVAIEPREAGALDAQLHALRPRVAARAEAENADVAAQGDVPNIMAAVFLMPDRAEARLLGASHVGAVDQALRHEVKIVRLAAVAVHGG